MPEIHFNLNKINENKDPDKGWELQFKLIDESKLVEECIHNQNFTFQIGSELWEVSASKSERQMQFNNNNECLWYIKGSFMETKTKKKYKNITHNSTHYSYDFTNALIKLYPLLKEQEYEGGFSLKDKLMFIGELP